MTHLQRRQEVETDPLSTASRRQALVLLAGALGGVAVMVGCQPSAAPATSTAANPLAKPRTTGAPLTAVLASSELARGRNRFAMGLIDAGNQPINQGQVHVEFFKVDQQNGTAQKQTEADAVFRAVELVQRGIWTSQVAFDQTGSWGAQITLARSGQPDLQARLTFEVSEHFSAPGYGEPAPRSASPTLRDVNGDVSQICSAQPPCPLHDLSIAEALQPAQKPLLVLFATPALCTSAICAPELSAVLKLREQGYLDRTTFVHVEIYEQPFEGQRPARTVDEWRLPSEPWVFLVDRGGVVRDRFEGAAPVEELEPALKNLV